MSGFVEMFVLFFIQVGTRRVHIAGITANPDTAWMKQQARNMAIVFAEEPVPPKYLLRDRDTKFVKAFDAIMKDEGMDVVKLAVRAPNMNGVAERYVQTVKKECLDHFLVFGEDHLRYISSEFNRHYHVCRPHQGLDNTPPCGPPPPLVSRVTTEDVVCETRLGGLLKHYRRAA